MSIKLVMSARQQKATYKEIDDAVCPTCGEVSSFQSYGELAVNPFSLYRLIRSESINFQIC